jgi:hypothetical protein
MNDADLRFLKRATPQELLKLTNGIPWVFCASIKVSLLAGHRSLVQGLDKERRAEGAVWLAAGAIHTAAEAKGWLQGRLSAPCDECSGLRDHNRGHRISFTKAGGFRWLELCGSCCGDHDYFHNPKLLVALATRWQGRCLSREAVQA